MRLTVRALDTLRAGGDTPRSTCLATRRRAIIVANLGSSLTKRSGRAKEPVLLFRPFDNLFAGVIRDFERFRSFGVFFSRLLECQFLLLREELWFHRGGGILATSQIRMQPDAA